MRGREVLSDNLFGHVRLKERVQADHLLWLIRALAEEMLAGLWTVKMRRKAKVEVRFTFAAAAYNLVRLPELLALPAA